ncbi:hypothetical protein NC653_036529 [Populus alba x Populus x berolinensis]|uniref:Uncharacterized protein n=1 Tax=Populus alba x Populus x berolinensis TaxID=444605 RepID=A0AAD6LKE0_9ROSI|nr:hypothetical protein NC653_036529 [Populus alba x Populus x berolinensis]
MSRKRYESGEDVKGWGGRKRLIELRLISKKLHVSIQTKICACVRSLCAWLPACHLHSSSERRWPWWMACKDSCML